MVLSLAILALLGACKGQPTPYQPAVDGYGYSEQGIEDNRYRVIFAGNDYTKADTVQNYLLYRAAEVTLDHGYGIYTMYNHLSVIGVTAGQAVAKGDQLGNVGDTGLVTGPHLHWEAHVNIDPVDPLQLVNGPLP